MKVVRQHLDPHLAIELSVEFTPVFWLPIDQNCTKTELGRIRNLDRDRTGQNTEDRVEEVSFSSRV